MPKLLILVHNRDVAAARSLMALLGDREEPTLTLIRAENHQLNRELRKLRPQWYFGADAVMLTQWQVFTALRLDPLAPTDFEWITKDWPAVKTSTSPRLYEELNRRGIGRILWANDPQQLKDKITDPHLLGVLTNRPKQILELLKVAGD